MASQNTDPIKPQQAPGASEGDDATSKNPYDLKDPEVIADISERIDKCLKADSFSRIFFESNWARNVFFFAGSQWLKRVGGRWERRSLPVWFPRTMTNKFAEKANDLITQLLQGGRVPITYSPASDDPADTGTADVGERIREVMYTEACCDEQAQTIASWMVITGNAFGIPHYDMSERFGTVKVQSPEIETSEPETPQTGEIANGSLEGDAEETPERKIPIAEEYPIGALQLEVCGPFEIRGDYRITDVRKWEKFVHQKRYDLHWAKENWPDFKDRIEPDAGTSNDTAQFYMDLFANLTPDFAFGAGLASNSSTSGKYPKVTAYALRELPSKKYPEGLYAVRLGRNSDCIVEAGPLPSTYGAGVKKGKKFLPLIHWGCNIVPGRLWRKTPMDDLVYLQVFRNMVEANIRLSVQRMGNAMWLLPKGCGVDILTGEPGQQVPYNPMSVGGTNFAKPERIPADLNNLGPLLDLLKFIDDAMERVAGTFFLQGGNAPPGVTAASALAYLGEKGQQSLSTLRTGWAQGWAEFDKMGLEIARENWDDNRIRAVAGKNKKWQVEKFTKADIQGAVNFIVDWNALAPKSNATERATIGQLVQLGFVNPQDPEMVIEVLKKFGELELKGSFDIDVQDAAKEEDRFLEKNQMPEVRPFVDNSQVHLLSHINFAKSDEFREMPQAKQRAWLGHIANTVTDITARRIHLTQMGLDPDVPALTEVPSQAAAVGEQAAQMLQAQQAAAQQNGGVPSGAEGPDDRLNPDGTQMVPASEDTQVPDLAAAGIAQPPAGAPQQAAPAGAPPTVMPPGSPRRIALPGGGQ
jgi:hypothetical protein